MTQEEQKAIQEDNQYFINNDDDNYVKIYLRTIFLCIILLFVITGFQLWEFIE